MKRIPIIISCIIFLVGSACSSQQPTQPLPTLVVMQTNTPSPTPTNRPTNTPTLTPTQTRTPTRTPTVTRTPSLTPVPSMTPTNTITPTATITPTDTATPTATATPTNVFASINRFDVFPEQALRGEQVVLSWETDADSVLLELLDQQTNVLDIFLLPPEGEQRVVVPRTVEDLVIFSMTARRLDTFDTLDRPVVVLCEFNWFFDDVRVADEGCPAASDISGVGAYQRFERGYMLYLPFTRQVYVLYGSDLAGSWVFEAASISNPIPPAPANSNLYSPQNQFAPIWLDTNAPNGRSWEDEIGYGVSPAIQTTVLAQDEDRSPVFYVGTANGFLFRFRRDPLQANIGFWDRIP